MNVEHLKPSGEPLPASIDQPGLIPLESLAVVPFANTRDSRFFYGSATHMDAFNQLKAMLEDGNQGWGCLSSSTGLGKTLLRTVLHRSLDPSRFMAISIENSLLDFEQLLLEIISQIRGERAYETEFPSLYSRLVEFKLLLTEQLVQSGRHLVLLLDEAQGLERDTLEKLRNLSNITAEPSNLMSFILIGDKRLDATLNRLPALAQRVAVRARLLPFDIAETGAYVQHHLRIAGSQQDLSIEDHDLENLHRVSGGVAREINKILMRAIDVARQSSGSLSSKSLRAVLDTPAPGTNAQASEYQSLGMS